ncbi:hypothetical protein QY97_02611 [Bacillus thermotolerans]|nr:hypothetical protein QY97_02611 [Bacillus thermotolerans]
MSHRFKANSAEWSPKPGGTIYLAATAFPPLLLQNTQNL